MLRTNVEMFVQLPSESKKRVLHPGKVKESKQQSFAVELEEPGLHIQAGQDVLIYCELKGKFMQQSARVTAIHEGAGPQTIVIETTGQPVSAESRDCYRVSTVIANLRARLHPNELCPLLDVSPTGCAVISKQRLNVGSHAELTLEHSAHEYSGRICVQSVRELDHGHFRYGLRCLSDRTLGGDLTKGLQQISIEMQRQQLRRLAGNQ